MNERAGADPIRVERTYPVSSARLWAAWTEPAQVVRWWAPDGFTEPDAEMDVREGGSFRISMNTPDGHRVVAVGRYLEVHPTRRLVYTWRWDSWGADRPDSRVSVTFEDDTDGARLVLDHAGLPDADAAAQHREGWIGCVDRMAGAIGV